MTTYRYKTAPTVTAWQWDGKTDRVGPFRGGVKSDQSAIWLTGMTNTTLLVGDWLVCIHDEFIVYTNVDFRDTFEAVEE